MVVIRRLMCVLILLLASVPAAAERFALLVGVSEYPGLRQQGLTGKDLKGPRNDVRLLSDTLKHMGFPAVNIRVVADGVEGLPVAAQPTRAGILAAFDELVGRLQPGDFLFVHFSGHGAQQPERDAGQEADGMDEVFLPRDAGLWDAASRSVRNAITDDEIAERLSRAAARGAGVWSVFDTCHSGSMTRGSIAARGLTSRELGIPLAPRSASDPVQALRKRPLDTASGARSVAFFATTAQSTTAEFRPSLLQNVHGLFTYVLVEGLRSFPGVTYRQLGEFIQQRYGALAMAEAGVPTFEGDLDVPLFGDAAVPRIRQWPVRVEDGSIWIDAGVLSLFDEGARFALLRGPMASPDDAVAFARAANVTATRARLIPIDRDGKALPVSSLPDAEGMFARLVDANPQFQVRAAVRLEREADGSPRAVRPEILDTLSGLRSNPGRGPRLLWVDEGEPSELEVLVSAGKVFVRAQSSPLVRAGPDATPSVDIPRAGAPAAALGAFADDLRVQLHRAAKAVNLLRVANQHVPDAAASKIRTWVVVRRAGTKQLLTLDASALPSLGAGDEIFVFAENGERVGVDITIFAMDPHQRLHAVFPTADEPDNHLPGQTPRRQIGRGFDLSDEVPGVERLVILATKRAPGAGSLGSDFRHLADDVPRSDSTARTRGLGDDGGDMLSQAMGEASPDIGRTRGVGRAKRDLTMWVYGWRTVKAP